MEIRTLAPNGILFYAHVTTHMYMCLYLQVGRKKSTYIFTIENKIAYDQKEKNIYIYTDNT